MLEYSKSLSALYSINNCYGNFAVELFTHVSTYFAKNMFFPYRWRKSGIERLRHLKSQSESEAETERESRSDYLLFIPLFSGS